VLCGLRRLAFNCPKTKIAYTSQFEESVDFACCVNPRKGADSFKHIIIESIPRVGCSRRKSDIHRKHARRVESKINIFQSKETAHEEPSGDQKNDSSCEFCDDEERVSACKGRPSRPDSGPKSGARIGARSFPRRENAKNTCRE
jgi:hypothetical protein